MRSLFALILLAATLSAQVNVIYQLADLPPGFLHDPGFQDWIFDVQRRTCRTNLGPDQDAECPVEAGARKYPNHVTEPLITSTRSNYAIGRGTPREFQLSTKIWF